LKPTLRILDHASHAHQPLVAYPSASASTSETLQSLLPSFDKLTVERTGGSDSGSDESEAQEIRLSSNIKLNAHENPASNDEALYVLCGIFLAEMQEINVYIKAQFQASANGTISPVIASIVASVGIHLLEKAVSRYSVMEADKIPSVTIQGCPGAGFLAVIHSIIAKYESRPDHTTLAKLYHVREEYFSPALQIYLQHFVNHSEGYGNVFGGRYLYISRFGTRFPLMNSTTATLGAANEETYRPYTYYWKSEVAPTLIRSWYHLGQDVYKNPSIMSICDRFTKQIAASLVQKKVLEFSPFAINTILDAISTLGSDLAGSRISFEAVAKTCEGTVATYEAQIRGKMPEFNEFRNFANAISGSKEIEFHIKHNHVLNGNLTSRALIKFRNGIAALEKSIPILECGLLVYSIITTMEFLKDRWPDFEYAIKAFGDQRLFNAEGPPSTWREFTSVMNITLQLSRERKPSSLTPQIALIMEYIENPSEKALRDLQRSLLYEIGERRKAADALGDLEQQDTRSTNPSSSSIARIRPLMTDVNISPPIPSTSKSKVKARAKDRHFHPTPPCNQSTPSITYASPIEDIRMVHDLLQSHGVRFDIYFDYLWLYRLCESVIMVVGEIYHQHRPDAQRGLHWIDHLKLFVTEPNKALRHKMCKALASRLASYIEGKGASIIQQTERLSGLSVPHIETAYTRKEKTS
jgi:hypothetical protein